MANGDNIDPKKQEELNARKQEGVDINREDFEILQNKGKVLEEIFQKYSGQNQLLQQNAASQLDITSQLKEQLKNAGENKEEIRETLNLSKQVATAIKSSIGPYSSIGEIEKQRGKNLQIQEQIKQKILSLGINEIGYQKELEDSIKRRLEFDAKSETLKKAAIDLQQQQLDAQDELNLAQKIGDEAAIITAEHKLQNLGKTQQELLKEAQLHSKNEQAASEITTSQVEQAQALLNTNKNLDDYNEKLDEHLKKKEAINNATGLSGKLLGVTNKLFGISESTSKSILANAEKRIEAINEQNSYYDEQGKLIENNVGKLRGFGIVVGETGKSILENITDPLILIGAILDYSAQTTKFSKELGVTRERAKQLKAEFSGLSFEMNKGLDGNVLNSERLMNSISGINSELGGMAFTFESIPLQQMAAEATIFQEAMGGTAEEATALMGSALITGTTFRGMQKDIVAVSNEFTKQTGLQINSGKLMREAAGVTGQIRAQLGGSVTEISKVLAVTKSFGMELNQIKNIAGGLLDFEQSISAELEAELLTGKQLNLEQARLYALTGDYEGLTKEINKNVGDFNDFSKMNVLQQEAIAKALGMSADEMSDMLFKQGTLEEMKAKARANNDTDTLKMLEQRDVQQQISDIVFQLKDAFAKAVGEAGGIEKVLSNVTGFIGKITNFASSDLGGMLIKFAIFSKLLGGPILNSLRIMKTLGGMIKLNTFAINAAEKIGLIRKGQANVLRGKEVMLQKFGNTQNKIRNMYENQSVLSMARRNVQEGLSNMKNSIGQGIDSARNAIANSTLLAKIKDGAVRGGILVKEKILLGLEKGKLLVGKLLNKTLIKQGLITMKNVAKKGIEVAMSAASAVAASARAAFTSLGPIPVVGVGLAIAAAAAAAALIYKLTKPKKTGDFMSKGKNISESATPGGLGGNEGLISVGGKTRTFDTNVDEVNISPNAVTGTTPIQVPMKTPPSVVNQQQDNSDVIAAINALGEKPGLAQQKTDTLPPPTDLFSNITKIGKGMYQEQNEAQVLFT